MKIPFEFSDKIIRMLGDNGREWLDELPHIINSCKEKWNLYNLSYTNDLSYNFVCFADSSDFGEVALKVGYPNIELYTEIKALQLYEGKNICKLYDFDKKLGALLLERITPGFNLTTINNNSERFEIAADLIYNLSIPNNDINSIPHYSDWVHKAFREAKKENIVGSKMLSLIDIAEKYYRDLENSQTTKTLIHGDLHHFNILQGKNSKWKIIDPKGVIGIPCLECARFIENQLSMVKKDEMFNSLDEMITVFSNKFSLSKQIITKGLFVDAVLSTTWSFEDNAKPEKIKLAIEKCEFIFDYLVKL